MTDPLIPGGLYSAFITRQLPGWVKYATGKDLQRLRGTQIDAQYSAAGLADWFTRATLRQRQALLASQVRLRSSKRGLAGLLRHFKGITDFAEPLLRARLKGEFGIEVDLHKAKLVRLSREWTFNGRWQSVTASSQSLLQAALQNFDSGATFTDDDCLTTDGAYTVAEAVIYQPADVTFTHPLTISVQAFARLCHDLDLGQRYQEHLAQVYDTPLSSSRIRYRSIEVYKDVLRVQLHIALMKSEISSAAHAAVTGLIDEHEKPLYLGKPVQVVQLSMYGIPLAGAWVLSVVSADALHPVIVYLPGALLYPLKEYASREAFRNDLRINLSQPAYLELFRGYVAKDQEQAFAKLLRQNLYHQVAGVYEPMFNPVGSLKLRSRTVGPALFKALQDEHLARLKADAKVLVVPSATADAQASAARWAFWEQQAVNGLNLAALFVPVLGEVMAAVMAEQLMLEAIEGADAWNNADRATAWAHVEALAINLAIAAGLAVAGTLKPKLDSSEVLDELVPIQLPSGERRLWRADLTPYARAVELDEATPDLQGVYSQGDKRYVRIEQQVYEVAKDATGSWRIETDVPHAYRPQLSAYGEGAWQAYGERPLLWQRQQLLRRLGHLTDGLSDTQLQQAADISGISDDVLRKVHVDRQPAPLQLADTLRRMQLDRQLTDFIEGMRNGTARGKALGFLPALAVELPQWPGRAIEVFSGPELWGRSKVYGRERWPHGPAIQLTAGELYEGKLPGLILGALDDASIDHLLGESTPRQARLGTLQQQLGDFVSGQRARVFDSFYTSGGPASDPGVRRIQQDFPRVSEAAARAMIATARGADRARLYAVDGRVPLRTAEQARAYQREARISQAIHGLYQPTLASLDSDRLAIAGMAKLPGWSATIRLELRVDNLHGRRVQRVGNDAGVLKSVVRTDSNYLVYDQNGLELGICRRIQDAVLSALTDQERQALGFSIHQGDRLVTALCAALGTDHEAVALTLGIAPTRPWFMPPMHLSERRVGYPLGGTTSRGRSASSRLRDLYPNMTSVQRQTLIETLGAVADLDTAVQRLEQEFASFRSALSTWADADDALERSRRGILRQRLEECWRTEGGNKLQLSGWPVSELPALNVRFVHVEVLVMDLMELQALAPGFLAAFPRLTVLSLDFNALTAVPEAISGCQALRFLSLSGNHISGGEHLLAPLRGLSRLQRLEMDGNALQALHPQALQDLAGLTRLHHLALSDNNLALATAGIELLSRLPLQVLDLSNNLISLDASAALAFSPMVQLQRLELSSNPLGSAPSMARMTALHHVDLSRCQLTAWPDALTPLMNRELYAVRTIVLSNNQIESLPDLAATRYGQAMERGDGSLHLDLNGNPLLPAAIQRLAQIGQQILDTDGVIDLGAAWLVGATDARLALWQALNLDPDFRPVFDVLHRLSASREAQLDLAGLRQRLWSVLEFAQAHQAFRDEMIEIADSYPDTCVDMSADAFSDVEIAHLVYAKALVAGSEQARSRSMFDLYRRLFRRSEVNRLADNISLARITRRAALLEPREGVPVPALSALDDIADQALLAHPVDDIEVRLKLRQALKDELDYPEPSSGMMFGELAEISSRTLTKVGKAVRANDTAQAREAWLTGQSSWTYYLRQRFAEQFRIVEAVWDDGMTYLEECADDEALSLTRLSPNVIDSLREVFPESLLWAEGTLHKVTMNDEQYLQAGRSLVRGRAQSVLLLIQSLTRSEKALQ